MIHLRLVTFFFFFFTLFSFFPDMFVISLDQGLWIIVPTGARLVFLVLCRMGQHCIWHDMTSSAFWLSRG